MFQEMNIKLIIILKNSFAPDVMISTCGLKTIKDVYFVTYLFQTVKNVKEGNVFLVVENYNFLLMLKTIV